MPQAPRKAVTVGTMTAPLPLNVQHRPEASRFEVDLGGAVGLCAYSRQGGTLLLTHTEVPAALQGRGIAAALVQAALAHARAQGWRVRPSCSYVRSYMRRHPETQDMLE